MPRVSYVPRTMPDADADAKRHLAARLRKALNDHGLSQSELARQLDVGRDAISNYVLGNHMPTPERLKRMAEILNLDPQDFLPPAMTAPTARHSSPLSFAAVAGKPGRFRITVDAEVDFDTGRQIMDLVNASPRP